MQLVSSILKYTGRKAEDGKRNSTQEVFKGVSKNRFSLQPITVYSSLLQQNLPRACRGALPFKLPEKLPAVSVAFYFSYLARHD